MPHIYKENFKLNASACFFKAPHEPILKAADPLKQPPLISLDKNKKLEGDAPITPVLKVIPSHYVNQPPLLLLDSDDIISQT